MSPDTRPDQPVITSNTSKTPKIIGAVLAIALVAGVIGWFSKQGDQPIASVSEETAPETTEPSQTEPVATKETLPAPNETSPSPSTQPAKEEKSYVDGTYAAAGEYVSPAGEEKITISITLKDGVITDSEFSGNTLNPISKKMQARFNDGFKEQVVGKSIDSLTLTAVNGASLVPKGFIDALSKIKVQAKA